MIKVKSLSYNADNSVDCVLNADTKAEVDSTPLDDIVGFPEGYTIGFFSTVVTASGDVAFMKSDGTWNWL